MLILRTTYYAQIDDEESNETKKDKWGTVKKIALGTAAAGLAFAGARRGMFGNAASIKTNQVWGNLGSKFNNNGMMQSAASQVGKARARQAMQAGMTQGQAMRMGVMQRRDAMNGWSNGNTWKFDSKNPFNVAKNATAMPTAIGPAKI